MAYLASVINECQCLHYLITEPDTIFSMDKNYFMSSEGRDLYDTLLLLRKKNMTLSKDNILVEGNTRNELINDELLNTVLETEIDIGKWNHYVAILRESYAQDKIQNEVLKNALENVTVKGRLDLDRLQALTYDLQGYVSLAKGDSATLMVLSQMFDMYEYALLRRQAGEYLFKTGCKFLDMVLAAGFAPGEITTLFGSTGVGKSTYALFLINRQINRRIPALYISLEMSTISTMDRLIASRTRIPVGVLCPQNPEDLDDSIMIRVRKERQVLEGVKTFYYVDDPALDMAKLEKLIVEAQLKSHSKYMIVTIDLLTMMREFSGEDPSGYEDGMNKLAMLAKRLGVHIVAVVQATQKSLEAHTPSSISGLGVFRPTLASIKNSGAIAERSRIVLGVFREKYYATRLFPDDPNVDLLDDLVEISVLKQSQGAVGQRVNYLHEEGTFRLFPVPEDYEPLTASSLKAREPPISDSSAH